MNPHNIPDDVQQELSRKVGEFLSDFRAQLSQKLLLFTMANEQLSIEQKAKLLQVIRLLLEYLTADMELPSVVAEITRQVNLQYAIEAARAEVGHAQSDTQ